MSWQGKKRLFTAKQSKPQGEQAHKLLFWIFFSSLAPSSMLQWCYQHLYFAISGVAYYSCFPFPSAWNRLVLGNVVLSGDDSNSQAGYLSEHFLILSSSWANWDSTPFLSAFRFFISTFTRAICSLSRAYWKKHNVATSENITITEIMLNHVTTITKIGHATSQSE